MFLIKNQHFLEMNRHCLHVIPPALVPICPNESGFFVEGRRSHHPCTGVEKLDNGIRQFSAQKIRGRIEKNSRERKFTKTIFLYIVCLYFRRKKGSWTLSNFVETPENTAPELVR